MTLSKSNYGGRKFKCYGVEAQESEIFEQVADNLIDTNIYAQCGSDYKGGEVTGYNRQENLLSREEAQEHIRQGGNVGIVLGTEINGVQYVLFDVEKTGILPPDLETIIQAHAVLTFDSPHEGRNRLVRIDDKETYALLRSLAKRETVNHLTPGDKDDLEIITSGHAMIPPSSIDHATCSEEKQEMTGCGGIGEDRYILQSVNPTAPAIDYDAVERLGDLLGLTPTEEEEEPERKTTADIDAPEPIPKINPKKEFQENVPSVSHTFDDRIDYMKFGDWEGQEHFLKLWNGNFEDVSGSNKQGKAECKIANYIGFFFGRNKNMIRFIMSTLPFESHYQEYPRHRKNLLEFASNVDWCYCEGVRFETKLKVAFRLWGRDVKTVSELAEETDLSEWQVRRTIDILEAEGLVGRNSVGRKRYILNYLITEGYILDLEQICEKYDKPKKPEDLTANVTRIQI